MPLLWKNMTPEQRRHRLDLDNARKRRKYAANRDLAEKVLADKRDYYHNRETPEARAKRLAKAKERSRAWYAALTPEQKQERFRRGYTKESMDRRNHKRRENEQGVETNDCMHLTTCGVCGDPLTSLTWPDPMSTTVGHEPPLSRAKELGVTVVTVRPEHWKCNHDKRDLTDDELLSRIA